MRVLGISWLGVYTEQFEAMRRFIQDVLGLRVQADGQDFAVFSTATGDKVEVFGREGPQAIYQFASNAIVVGFLVDEIESARHTLEEAGIELLGELQQTASGYAWQHFRGPDGHVYELTYDPERSWLDRSVH